MLPAIINANQLLSSERSLLKFMTCVLDVNKYSLYEDSLFGKELLYPQLSVISSLSWLCNLPNQLHTNMLTNTLGTNVIK